MNGMGEGAKVRNRVKVTHIFASLGYERVDVNVDVEGLYLCMQVRVLLLMLLAPSFSITSCFLQTLDIVAYGTHLSTRTKCKQNLVVDSICFLN